MITTNVKTKGVEKFITMMEKELIECDKTIKIYSFKKAVADAMGKKMSKQATTKCEMAKAIKKVVTANIEQAKANNILCFYMHSGSDSYAYWIKEVISDTEMVVEHLHCKASEKDFMGDFSICEQVNSERCGEKTTRTKSGRNANGYTKWDFHYGTIIFRLCDPTNISQYLDPCF